MAINKDEYDLLSKEDLIVHTSADREHHLDALEQCFEYAKQVAKDTERKVFVTLWFDKENFGVPIRPSGNLEEAKNCYDDAIRNSPLS